MNRRRRTWELDPGELPDDPLFHQIAESEAREYLADWQRTGNGAHVWRAWRCLRLLPSIPADLQPLILEYLDLAARGIVWADGPTAIAQSLRMSAPSGARGEGNSGADEQSSDGFLVIRFRHLQRMAERKGEVPNKTAIYRRLAKELGAPSWQAVKQRIMRIEGRGQRGK